MLKDFAEIIATIAMLWRVAMQRIGVVRPRVGESPHVSAHFGRAISICAFEPAGHSLGTYPDQAAEAGMRAADTEGQGSCHTWVGPVGNPQEPSSEQLVCRD